MRFALVFVLWGCNAAAIACDPDAPNCPEGFVCRHDGECQAYSASEEPLDPATCVPFACADFNGSCGDFDDGCGGVISCACAEGSLCASEMESNGSIASGDRGAGQITWVHLPSSLQCNGEGAKALLDGAAGQGTRRLEIQSLAVPIPDTAAILEIMVTVRRKKDGPALVHDELVSLTLGGVPIGENMAKTDAWPSLEWGDAVYTHSDWGVPGGLTPAMINDPSFGVGLRAKKEGDHSVTAYVDCATVLVRLSCDAT